MGDRPVVSVDATPELRERLRHRLRVIDGGPSASGVAGSPLQMRRPRGEASRGLLEKEQQRLLLYTDELLAAGDWLSRQKGQMLHIHEELHAVASGLDQGKETEEEQPSDVDGGSEAAASSALLSQVQQLQAENASLRAEVEDLRSSALREVPAPEASSSSCSGCRLRVAMTSQGTPPDELETAIGVVEALLGEARRELAAKQLRCRRAAYEALHRALEQGKDEAVLAEALAAAKKAGVDEEEIARAQTKLTELQEQTPEERLAEVRRELEAKLKKEAFLLVKRNHAEALSSLLEGLDEGIRWQTWRDHAGRTLQRCSKELRADKAQAVLAGLAAAAEDPTPRPRLPSAPPSAVIKDLKGQSHGALGAPPVEVPHADAQHGAEDQVPLEVSVLSTPTSARSNEPLSSSEEATGDATSGRATSASAPSGSGGATGADDVVRVSGFHVIADATQATTVGRDLLRSPARPSSDEVAPSPRRSPRQRPRLQVGLSKSEPSSPAALSEQDKLKARAFRAVVQDNVEELAKVFDDVSVDVWKHWENKAGKDLLTLSQERGSAGAYSQLAKALGLLKEQKREVFEEREAVWIFVNGDVQPRRATVMEDTPEEADEILVEYWEGYAPAEYVDRSSVRKMAS